MAISGKELIKELKRAGFEVERIKGSHYMMKKGKCRVVVPNHSKDLPIGTEIAIKKQAGLI